MPKKRNHEENLQALCAMCLRRAHCPLTEHQIELIQSTVYEGFKVERQYLPSGICDGCRRKLSSLSCPDSRPIPVLLAYDQIVTDLQSLPPSTRGNPDCNCELCSLASSHRSSSAVPDTKYLATGPPAGRGHPAVAEATAIQKLCSHCMSRIGPGLEHRCNKTTKLKNLRDKISPLTKHQLASSVIKECNEAAAGGIVLSQTAGKPLRVKVASSSAAEPITSVSRKGYISHETISALKVGLSLSSKQTLKLASILRLGAGQHVIEPNLREELQKRGRCLTSFFTLVQLPFIRSSGQTQEVSGPRPAVICSDLQGLLNHICTERGIENSFVKIGIDGGGGSLKVVLTVNGESEPAASPVKKLACSRQFLNSGVKKLMIIAIAPDVSETYLNVKLLLDSLNLQAISFTVACDLKLANIVIGLQNHAAMYPCTWCEAKAPFTADGLTRTFGSVTKNAAAFSEAGNELRSAKLFKSCVNKPLLSGGEDEPILNKLPPPELHLLIGVVNKIVDSLEADGGHVLSWAASHNIGRADYRGGSFEGNQCHAILQLADELTSILPEQLKQFGEALRCFCEVVHACFGEKLQPEYEQLIQQFRESYCKLPIRVTPKFTVCSSMWSSFADCMAKAWAHFLSRLVKVLTMISVKYGKTLSAGVVTQRWDNSFYRLRYNLIAVICNCL
ncbi:hypothetical protein BOX15_Mlig027848g1 [Macrostomum lignano]|uniref:Uncharacterized protein n=1 Tax=Macrostomum lignano TaxID=282301 RepID=A0A267GV11_9PLAT|nr:hypothetical protein BOX15_Mlig027848g1 [Macrostomum lignano]